MNTDRTTAPAPRHSSALAERPSPGRPSTAPSDTFAVLLGAAAPSTDTHAPARRPEQPERDHRAERTDRRRDDHASHAADRHRADDAHERRPADHGAAGATTDKPQAPDAPTTPVAAAPADAPATPAAAPAANALIAAQLSSPLAAAPAQPAPAPAPAAAQPAPVKVLSGLVAASTVPAPPVAGQPVAGAAPVPAQAADAATPVDPAALTAATGLPPVGPGAAKPLSQPIPAFAKPAGDAQPVVAAPAKPAAPAAPAAAPAPAAPTVTASAPAAAAQVADATAKPSDAPAPAPAPTQAAAPLAGAAFAAPASAPGNVPTPAPQRLVPMTRVVENTAALLRVAADRGVTHARLNLKPAELGGIEVRLRATPDGVAARLVADSPDAARMLSQAGDDLRRQLAAQNVNLLSLDVSTSGEQQQSAAQFAADAGADHGYRSGGAWRHSHDAGSGDLAAPAATESTLLLPTGVLVDVLA